MTSTLSPVAYVVLGLTSIWPGGGHEIAQFGEHSVSSFYPLTRSHVFTELNRLHEAGFLNAEEVVQERRPDKRKYTITDAGREALHEWLEEATIPPDRLRNSFLVRVFFADLMSPEKFESLLDDYERTSQERRDQLAEVVAMLADNPDWAYRRATAAFGMRIEQAKLDWVVDMRAVIDQAPNAGTEE